MLNHINRFATNKHITKISKYTELTKRHKKRTFHKKNGMCLKGPQC